ncbi:type II toxin-antitoxin system PemK/MazF family toxin [Spirosoma spitsbergense]|uniref:type II toxin-antitoxin system PemK/MazF family toxin n=1 Tax=Spirosoma spitsbergense TaxID=431554 RepID=UPI0003735E93|nr:type II toxin-antitoxin system PemK/MazF family toxin [Spirosoma spitsbergense]
MKQGDLIVVPFPFTDLSGSKIRPALVLLATPFDVTLAFITTQLQWQEPTDLVITPTRLNGLKKLSLVRLSKLATIDANLAQGLLGTLDAAQLQSVHQNLRLLLQL